MALVGIEQIRRAAADVAGVAVRTALLPQLWGATDRPLWLKPESLQPIGSFKIRGAYHAITVLPGEVRARGVITHSSGNHGQAVAYAAARYGVPAVVVVPNVSPAVKVDAVRRLGAEVVLVEPAERFRAARELAAARGLTLVPPYDDPDVIAGQGTVALEVLADLPDVDVVLVPVGGGGLASGVGAAVKAIRPETAVYGVEPDAAPTPATRSRRGGSSRTRTSSGTPRSPTGCAPRCPS